MSLLNILSRGCSNHHWGEKEEYPPGKRRLVEVDGPGAREYLLQRKVQWRCLHSGCGEKKVEWEVVGTVSRAQLDSLVDT